MRENKQSGSPLFQSAAEAFQRGHMLATHRERALTDLTNTLDQLSEPQLSEIVQTIIAARQMLVFGSSSHAFAQYLRWQIIQVVPQVISLPGLGETLAEYTAQLGKSDCVILFGMRCQTRQMAVCDLLATMVLEATGAPGRKRLAAIEQQHEQHQEF